MPLLNKKPLELHRYNKKLKDDAEVFYCKCTNEIFEDYEEYCQRVISCNSLIWSCAITGKSNLTYQEALTSEQNALKSIKDFPLELRTPVLYLAAKTNRKNFNDLVNDVFNFAKDRYFLGEFVEVNFDGTWLYGHVLQVLLPEKEKVEKYKKENGIEGPIGTRPYPSCLYKYEVEKLDDDSDVSEVRVVPSDRIRRVKSVLTRKKTRIYLRQFVEMKKDKWRVQNNILAKYSISSISFSQMFVGESPTFEDSPSNESKLIQQTLHSFLTKSPEKNKPKKVEASKKMIDLKNIHKKYQDTIDKVVQQSRKEEIKKQALEEKAKKLEELKKKREQKKQEREELATFAKEWSRKREDLECEDLKTLPDPCPVTARVPNEHFGDVVMILEFFSSFHKVLIVKDSFVAGLTFEVVERALVEVEVAGPFSDILQVLLCTLFSLQDREDREVQNTDIHRFTDFEREFGDTSIAEAIKLATAAASWSKAHYGVPLSELSLDAITLSEILRLHLLASGGGPGYRCSRWRYQERGGYVSTDDPCLMLRVKEPHILRFLAVKSVAELPIGDKVKVLSCLMDQILTYAELRDEIEERYEKVKNIKMGLKTDQVAEAKKVKELIALKAKEKREAKEKGEAVPEEVEKEIGASSSRRKELQRRAIELQKAALDCHIAPLGQDRSYRRFWIFTTLGGLFVEDHEEFPGSCLAEPTPIGRNLASIEEDTMSYIKKLFEEERNCGSDKENEGNSSHPVGSPKKKLLSESNDLSNTINSVLPSVKAEGEGEEKPPTSVCTANNETCPVHSWQKGRKRWLFYHRKSDIEELINCLNKRGYREHRLRKALIESMDNIIPKLGQCPVRLLTRFSPGANANAQTTFKYTRSQRAYSYDKVNLRFPPGTPIQDILELYLRELILDTEDKLFCGGLGIIKVEDRYSWREAIRCRTYDRQDDNLTWPQYPIRKEKEDDASRPDTPCSMDSSSDQDVISAKVDQNQMVKDLASAVLQIARSIDPRNLQKPLWEKKMERSPVMERWESSLMSSTSFSQVYLHMATLESSVQWRKSALNARCKVCKRGGDAKNMLLCDSCNRGFHKYCLEPKLANIPRGSWFCAQCWAKKNEEKKKVEESDDEDDQPLAFAKNRRSKSEDRSRRGKRGRPEDEDSGDEPLAKIAKSCRRSTQRKDVD